MEKIFEYLDKIGIEYQDRLKEAQSELSTKIIDYLDGELDIKDGLIVSSGRNYGKAFLIENFYNTFIKENQAPLFRWFFSKLMDIFDLNRDYFAKFEKDEKRFTSIRDRVLQAQFDRLGYDGKEFVKGGVLHDLANSTDPTRLLKAEIIGAIAQGKSFKEFKKDYIAKINGNGSNGVLQKHFNTTTYDTFTQFDREVANTFADEQGLNYARYSGGLKDTSRPFCQARNTKIFHRDEIKKWADLSFDGKSSPYNPFRDLGGYGCRHKLVWISDTQAKRVLAEKLGILPIKDLESFAKENNLAKYVRYLDLNPKIAIDINDTLLDFKKLTGQTFNSIKTVSNLSSSVPLAVQIKENGYDLLINKQWFNKFNSIEDLNIKILNRYTNEHWQPQDIRGMVAHEFGHLLTLDKTKLLDTSFLEKNTLPVSNYAKTNLNETLAEIFAKYYHNGIENISAIEQSLFNNYSKYKI